MRFDENRSIYAKMRLKTRFLKLFKLDFGLFWSDIALKFFKNNILRINSTRAFDWYMNCHIWMKKI